MERLLLSLALVSLLALAPPAGARPTERLPDLDQVAPAELRVKEVGSKGGRSFRLGFASATENRGTGPLTLHGFRRDRRTKTMQVDQLVRRRNGSSRLIRDAGGMRYVVHPDHRHWHLIGFARYELRRVGHPRAPALTDRKTGFCLGDRYEIPGAKRLPAFSPFPAQGDTCGLGRSKLRGLFAGISVGYGDRYAAHLEGQYIDITDAPAGRYMLVHTANPDGNLLESDYSNNSSSVLLSLRWPRGRRDAPAVKVLAKCPGGAICPRSKVSSNNPGRQDVPATPRPAAGRVGGSSRVCVLAGQRDRRSAQAPQAL